MRHFWNGRATVATSARPGSRSRISSPETSIAGTQLDTGVAGVIGRERLDPRGKRLQGARR